jgi:hypothetical protein
VLVALTGRPYPEDRSCAEEPDFHFVKPAEPAALLDLLGRCAGTRVT